MMRSRPIAREHGAQCRHPLGPAGSWCYRSRDDLLGHPGHREELIMTLWKQRLYLFSSCAAGLADSIIIMRGLRERGRRRHYSTDISLMEVNIIFAMFLCKTYLQ